MPAQPHTSFFGGEQVPLLDLSTPSLTVVQEGALVTLWLNRPQVHHALDAPLLEALDRAFGHLPTDCRIVSLRAEGKTFCAGADLAWMRLPDTNAAQEPSALLAAVLERLTLLPQITVAVVQGHAIGGGVGLLAACDYVLSDAQATFRLAEGRLGLAPAIIAPYLARRTQGRALRQMALTGRSLPASEAHTLGLVDELYAAQEKAAAYETLLFDLLHTAPEAVVPIKTLIARGHNLAPKEARMLLQTLRSGPQAQAGIASFLNKSRPPWAPGQ